MKHLEQNGFWFAKKTTLFTFNRLFMTLLFVASVTACNKEEFYEKDYLDNPYRDDTEVTGGSNGGDTSGVDGSAQGGVDSGVTSGTTNGTTGGSTTGDTTGGSTTGDTTGGSTSGGTTGGSTTGDTTGGSTTGDTTGGSTTGDTTGGSTTGSTSGGTTGGTIGDCNNGHGNDADGTDESNPGAGTGGPNDGKVYSADELCNATENFQQSEENKKIDILWVIDNSGSMADEQQALADNFDSFINGFIAKDVDFKMAIKTTDVSTAARKAAIVSGSDTALTSAKAKENQQLFYDDFMRMVKVGTSGSGYEKGLEATEGFLDNHAAWIRPEAYLAVVVLSDEEDQSRETVQFYVDKLKGIKAQDGLVKVHSIVNVNNVNTGGNTIGHVRYKEASERTAGMVANIMDRYDHILMEMGESLVNLIDSFALGAYPMNGSLKVFVNGTETTAYTYDPASNSIKFDAGNLPPVGAQVTVKYTRVK